MPLDEGIVCWSGLEGGPESAGWTMETVIGRSRWRALVGPSMTGKPQRR